MTYKCLAGQHGRFASISRVFSRYFNWRFLHFCVLRESLLEVLAVIVGKSLAIQPCTSPMSVAGDNQQPHGASLDTCTTTTTFPFSVPLDHERPHTKGLDATH
jgi:hypothetical protein